MEKGSHIIFKLIDDTNLRYKFTGVYPEIGRLHIEPGKLILTIWIRKFLLKLNNGTTKVFYAVVDSKSLKKIFYWLTRKKGRKEN
jgi:hypothetical protein